MKAPGHRRGRHVLSKGERETIARRAKERAEMRAAALAANPSCAVCGAALAVPKTGEIPTMCSKKCRQADWQRRRSIERPTACQCGAERAPGRVRCAACHEKALAVCRAAKARARLSRSEDAAAETLARWLDRVRAGEWARDAAIADAKMAAWLAEGRSAAALARSASRR